jgi:REP element-mobilizing transposase RayT
MPTHFHFLVRVKDVNSSVDFESSDEYSQAISMKVAILLRSYTRAYNKMWSRHGNLFNQHTKAKEIASDTYLITLLTYIHQNPIRSNLVEEAENWLFSSYQDYIDLRDGTLPSKDMILGMIKKKELKELTERKLIACI